MEELVMRRDGRTDDAIPGPCYEAPVGLPIEVLRAEGTVVECSVVVPAGVARGAAFLWPQVNNLGYGDQGTEKINDGAWLSPNHGTVVMQQQALGRGAMAHHWFNTIRFSIPATGIHDDVNTLRFRFDVSDGITIGYRVVCLQLLRRNGHECSILEHSWKTAQRSGKHRILA